MTPFEAFLAFLTVMGIIAVPLSAIITRSRSPIGQAIAERIRRKTERKLGPSPASLGGTARSGASIPASASPGAAEAESRLLEIVERQEETLTMMSSRLEFLERLLERDEAAPGARPGPAPTGGASGDR
ncbi:MAG: hypothetical protein ACOC1U_03290 [Spirochaetota bacterium]